MLRKAFHQFFQKNKVWKILGLLVITLLIAVRFLWLNEFPPGINHDETDVTLSARSIWKTGKDISGVPFPSYFFFTKTDAGLAMLPSTIFSPIYGLFKLSAWGDRLPYVFVNLLTVFAISYLAYILTKKKSIFWISLFVSLTNPWLFYYSKVANESPLALLFVLIGIIVFLKAKIDTKVLYSIPLFLASFFSYQGAKVTIPIFVILFVLFSKIARNLKFKYLLIFLVLPVIYYLVSYFSGGSTFHKRQNELIFSKLPYYSSITNEQRRGSIDFPLKNLYYNKYSYLTGQVLKKYVSFISPEFLFFRGDEAVLFEEQGLMLLVDLIFILIGLAVISRYRSGKRMDAWALVALLFISGTTSSAISVSSTQYIYRGYLLIPGLILLIVFGIDFLAEKLRFSPIHYLLIGLIYLFSFVWFLVFFFFRHPILGQENNFLSERVLSSYLVRLEFQNKLDGVSVVTPFPERVRGEYYFFSNSDTSPDISEDCGNINPENTFVISSKIICPQEKDLKPIVIQNQIDTGAIFKIYNDKLCTGINMVPYRRSHFVSDYNIEKMDNATFCNRWIGKYEQI
jgi:hypothetical protein